MKFSQTRNSWDYIVIGAGSAGCVVANRLSADAGQRVLLLEAGPRNCSLLFRIPSAPGVFGYKRYDWGFHSAPDPTRRGKQERWPRGRVVGGSSSINGMNYVRGASCDFDRWAMLGNPGWSSKDIMPLFREIERCDRGIREADREGLRGYEGPLHVKTVGGRGGRHILTQAFIEAAQNAGHPFNRDYNGVTQEGVGYTQASQRRGRRWSAADAFITPALSRSNFTLMSDALVHKVLIEQGRANAVRYEVEGEIREARGRHVILCAGAINTPQLLMLSGVGEARVLQSLGIEVVIDRPAVGRNLAEHPLLQFVYRVNVPAYNLTGGLFQRAGFLAHYLLKGEGPLSMGVESIAFLRTSPNEREPDVQLHLGLFGWNPEGVNSGGLTLTEAAHDFPCLSMLINKSRPVSRGQVRLASADPNAKPVIEPQLLDREEDVETLMRSVRMARRIVGQAPLARYVVEEIHPGNEVVSETDLREYVRCNTDIAAHPVGTCRMGTDEQAVVTPQLQVRGIENLWIADASIMPDLISGNTNAVCMVIGDKLGRMLAV